MTTTEKLHKLGDDLPKSNPWRDDRLGYAPFAKRIASVIIKMAAPNGYVIGVHGPWGSGKSTALNFTLEYLKKHNAEHENEQIIHIDFRPWMVAGHQDLIVAFFKLLSEKLGPKGTRWIRFTKRVASYISGTTDNLVDAAATVALTIDPSGGAASGFAGNLAKKSVNAVLSRYLDNPSLQTAYEELKTQLDRSGKRFLITIDDIDRLEDKDVKSIMQMVKSTGQLPNVIYLLAYDRNIVNAALDQSTDRTRPRFSEKIVQQEIELPQPSKNSLLSILDREIAFLIETAEDNMRWHYIVRDGIRRWVNSPRDVVKLSNAVKFSWPALENEIDVQDLLAMEGIRLFDQGAFSWIKDNRDFLLTDGRFIMAQDELKTAAVNNLKRRIQDEDVQPQVLRVLSVLFPQSVKWFEGGIGNEEAFDEVVKRRGIGCQAGFDTYFGLHPSADFIPKASIDNLMSQLDDVDAIVAIIRSYLGKTNSRGEPMIGKLLDELRARYRGNNPAPPTQSLLDGLFRVGENVIGIQWDGGMFSFSPRTQLSFLVRNMLERWGEHDAGAHLITAFNRATSVAMLSEVYVDRGRELGTFPSSSSERPLIDLESFGALGRILLSKILASVSDGSLGNAPFFFDIVRAWSHLGNPEEVKGWLSAGMLQSADFMVKVGQGLVSYSVGTHYRRYTMRDTPDVQLYNLEVLVEAGTKHLSATLTDDQRNLLSEIVRRVTQILSGNTSVQTQEFDDD
ncbi:P-loop NTPase fold protein [Phyllobacterium sp. TAF24]|uniref:KAP family P-loop NTPase fold protein n=1 Tax=Phyllobacterium sp. TAF24 TaxID=3233068 RepID=UPI003F9DF602